MALRFISIAFVLAGAALLGVAAYFACTPGPEPAFVATEPEIDVGECQVGQRTIVRFQLQSNLAGPARLVILGFG